MSYRFRTIGVVMVGVLALVACGGSDDSSDDDGDGSNDEAQESLEEAGVDLDLDELEETVTGFSTGDGGGVVTIDGVAYEYVAEICIVQGTDFVASGPGQGSDGTPAWVEAESSVGFDFDGALRRQTQLVTPEHQPTLKSEEPVTFEASCSGGELQLRNSSPRT